MSTEELMKQEADKMIDRLKAQCNEKGKTLTETEEMYIRVGMSYGLSLASIGLGFLSTDITMGKFM